MSIGQFLIIFWARRAFITAATVSCLIGALIVCAILPPQWQSSARIVLDYIKPDPVTGQLIAGASARFYVQTQQELVTDYTVAGRVAEMVGWLTDPAELKAYSKRDKGDHRDFRHWAADNVIRSTKSKLVTGTNILEISYTASSSDASQKVADALRRAYIDATLEFRREDAERNAVWYEEQVARAKQNLDTAVGAEAAFEKANGLVMQENKMDAESAKLLALDQEGTPISAPALPMTDTTASALQLAATEADLQAALKTLGPNNPQVQELQSKKAQLSALVERDKVTQRAQEARIMAAGAGALEKAVSAQKAKVIANSDKIGRLQQLHQDVELQRDQYAQMQAKLSGFRQEALTVDAGVTSLGPALTPKAPVFPNYFLVVPGALILGLGVGVGVSLLMELLGRRVRSGEDLDIPGEAPLICVIPGPEKSAARKPAGGRGWRFWWFAKRGAVSA